MRKTAALIADFERRTRGQKLRPELREQIDVSLARARKFAGLDSRKSTTEESTIRKKAAAGRRRSTG